MKPFRLFFLLTYLISFGVAFPQESEIDKLKKSLNNKIHDTTRCQIYQELADLCEDDEWPAFNKKLQTLALSNISTDSKLKRKYTIFLIKSLNNSGYLKHYLGDVKSAKSFHYEALKYANQIEDQSSKAEIFNHLGYIFKSEGNITKALEFYGKSLRIEESLNKIEELNYTYNNIGVIHFNMGDEEKALFYFSKSFKMQESLKDSLSMAHSLINFGSIFLKQKKYKEAEEKLRTSVKIMERLGEKRGLAVAQNYLGNVLLNVGQLDAALKFCNQSYTLQKETQNSKGIANVEKNMANIYLKKKQLTTARVYAERSLVHAKKINNLEIIKEVSFILYSISKKEGKLVDALKHFESYINSKEQIINDENKKKTYQLHLQYEYDKKAIADSINFVKSKEKAISEFRTKEKLQKLENENLERKNFFQIIMLLVSIVLLAGSILFARFYVKKFREKNSLSLQLSESVKERDLLNKEIHHRVKNNLQIISSLLNLQKNEQIDEKLIQVLQQSQNRIQAMALIHEKLYQSGNLKDVKLGEYIETLLAYFASTYQFESSGISYSIDLPDIQIQTDQLIPIGLITNEIVLNSIKYAFVNRKDKKINIFGKIEDEFCQLVYQDNGVGLPDDWEIKSKTSLGMNLIHGLTKQIRGKSKVFSRDGTRIEIEFKIAV